MPLDRSKNKAAFSRNVAELVRSGHPVKQAVAIAYRVRDEVQKAGVQLAGQTGVGAMQLEGGFNLRGKKRTAAEILGEIAKACPGNQIVKKALDLEQLARLDHQPSQGRKDAGNYRMGHARIHGLDITIETPKGGTRTGTDRTGRTWSCTMGADYGYIRGIEGADKDHLDCYLGPDHEADEVHLIHQIDPETGAFDELKCCLGFPSKHDAVQAYQRSYEPGWKGLGRVQTLSVPAFKEWLKTQPRTVAKAQTSHFLVTTTGKIIA